MFLLLLLFFACQIPVASNNLTQKAQWMVLRATRHSALHVNYMVVMLGQHGTSKHDYAHAILLVTCEERCLTCSRDSSKEGCERINVILISHLFAAAPMNRTNICKCLDILNCKTCWDWSLEALDNCHVYTEGPTTYFLKATDETIAIWNSIYDRSESVTVRNARVRDFVVKNCQFIEREGRPLEIVDRSNPKTKL